MAPREALTKDAPTSNVNDQIKQFEPALRIERDALDDCLMEQPDTFYRVAKLLALQTSRRDAAKQNLAIVEATIDRDIRVASRSREEKITEKEIASQLLLHKDVKAASDEFLFLTRQCGELSALKEAFQQRSYVLKDLVALYIGSYWGDAASSLANRNNRDNDASAARKGMNAQRRASHD